MKHLSHRFKLGRTSKHRIALRYNLARSLILHGKIVTTEAKAKFLSPMVEKLVTLAKKKDLESYRYILSSLRGDEVSSQKLVSEYANKFKDRNGGYLKTVKIGSRIGDSAAKSLVFFT